jgi:hypothetical protein
MEQYGFSKKLGTESVSYKLENEPLSAIRNVLIVGGIDQKRIHSKLSGNNTAPSGVDVHYCSRQGSLADV